MFGYVDNPYFITFHSFINYFLPSAYFISKFFLKKLLVYYKLCKLRSNQMEEQFEAVENRARSPGTPTLPSCP